MYPFGAHTVEVIAPPQRDRHGDPVPEAEQAVAVAGCFVQPATSVENVDGRDTVVSVWDLILPPGVAITAHHTVRFRGELYAVDGAPQTWDDISGEQHHLEVRLRHVTG